MKEKIKNILLIIWILISLKIFWITSNYVFNFSISLIIKCLQIPPHIAHIYIWPYLPFSIIPYENLGSEFAKQTIVPIVRGFTDLLLFSFAINGWISYFLCKTNTIKIKDYFYISLPFIFFYVWFLQDIFEIFIFKEIIVGLENTLFITITKILFLIICVLNIVTLFIICGNLKWSLIKKIFFASGFIILNGIILQTVYLSLLWNEGGLAFMLTNPNILNSPQFYGPTDLTEILKELYRSYGLNIAWCNPTSEIPCEEIRKQIERLCPIPDMLNKMPLGGRSAKSQVLGQTFQLGSSWASGCTELRNLLDACMEEHLRGEFVRRWMESHPPTMPKPFVGGTVIDTWSAYIKK
jgi:hypothetical protein